MTHGADGREKRFTLFQASAFLQHREVTKESIKLKTKESVRTERTKHEFLTADKAGAQQQQVVASRTAAKSSATKEGRREGGSRGRGGDWFRPVVGRASVAHRLPAVDRR